MIIFYSVNSYNNDYFIFCKYNYIILWFEQKACYLLIL